MATKILSDQLFSGGAKITGLPSSTANGQPVVHEQLSAVTGSLTYQSAWNASTNSPAIPAAAAGNKGYYYVVSVAGTTSIDGIAVWAPQDWIVSNGTAWQKVDNSEDPASETVAGVLEIATQAETDAGTDDVRSVTPLKLATYSGRAKRFSQAIGDGSATAIAVTHSLGTKDIVASVREVSSDAKVDVDCVSTSTTVATFTFATAPAANAYRVTIIA